MFQSPSFEFLGSGEFRGEFQHWTKRVKASYTVLQFLTHLCVNVATLALKFYQKRVFFFFHDFLMSFCHG